MNTQPAPFQSASLYVGDLHPEVTESILYDFFTRVGPVASIRVCRDMVTKRSLGYAYVNFHNVQDAERAIDTMNFTDIRGRPCRLMWSQRDPSVRKSGVGNIFIKNLPPTLDNKSLFDIFSVYGNILSCKVATDDTGNSKGYGYIHYDTAEAAQDAISKFNGNSIDDHVIDVLPFIKRSDRSNANAWTNTYLKQFPKSWDEAQLRKLVEPFGEVASVAIMRESDGSSKGFGFVSFNDHESASRAVDALSKYTIEDGGQQYSIYISKAQKKVERQRELQSQLAQKREEKLNLYQGRNLYVKNIDDEVTDEELLRIFSEHGSVSNARIMRDASGTSRGFGFVCYNLQEDAQKAISALNGFRLRSKPLVVTLHQRKEVRKSYLQQNANDRYRFLPQAANMGPLPYMMMPGGQNPGFPRQQFYGAEYPRGAPSPRGGGGGGGGVVRNFYSLPPYGVQPGQQLPAPISGQQPSQAGQGQGQVKRLPNGQPIPQQAPVPGRGAPQAVVSGRGPIPGRGPYPGAPPGRGPQMVPQGAVAYPPRGAVKFTNQVRNPPMGIEPGIPQQMPVQMSGVPHMMPNLAEPLDSMLLASSSPQDQKNMIGERLYPLVQVYEIQRAGKITGMLLEMEIAELLNLLESPDALHSKVREALMVLEQHERSVDQGLSQ